MLPKSPDIFVWTSVIYAIFSVNTYIVPFNFSSKKGKKPLNWNHKAKSELDQEVIPQWCQMPKNSSCQSCISPCGEDKKKSMDPKNCKEFSHFKRPNFTLKRNYEIFWHGENQSLDGPLGQKFYCCYVTVPKM